MMPLSFPAAFKVNMVKQLGVTSFSRCGELPAGQTGLWTETICPVIMFTVNNDTQDLEIVRGYAV